MTNRSDQSRWIALMVLTAIALYLCWRMLEPFLSVLVWSVVLVIVFFPLHERIAARIKRPGLSASVTILVIMFTVIVPLLLITTAVANEMAKAASTAQDTVEQVLADPVKGQKIRQLLDLAKQYVKVNEVLSAESLQEYAGKASQSILKGTVNVVGGALGAVVKIFFVLFTMYYLFRDGQKVVDALPEMLPLENEQGARILHRTRDIINASVYGVLVIALVQGLLGGLMFWFLGVPSSLLWGVLMTLLSTIPMAGAFIVWVPVAVVLALTGHWVKALILTAWGTLVIGMADNLLRPTLVGQKTKMHELLIFFSVLGGLTVFGVLGILMGPVVLASTVALLDILRQKPVVNRPSPLSE